MDEIKNTQLNNREFSTQDEIDIKEVWRIIRTHRKAIGAIFFVVLGLAIYISLTTQPIYQATTVVMIKGSESNAGSFVFDFAMTSSKQRLQNEIEVLNSYYLHDNFVIPMVF